MRRWNLNDDRDRAILLDARNAAETKRAVLEFTIRYWALAVLIGTVAAVLGGWWGFFSAYCALVAIEETADAFAEPVIVGPPQDTLWPAIKIVGFAVASLLCLGRA